MKYEYEYRNKCTNPKCDYHGNEYARTKPCPKCASEISVAQSIYMKKINYKFFGLLKEVTYTYIGDRIRNKA